MVRRKYGNKIVEVNGIKFDSLKESKRYLDLKLLERARKITMLNVQPKFTLQEVFIDRDGVTHKRITYVADFSYFNEQGQIVVEDVKSEITAKDKVYVLKKKLFLKNYPDVIFKEII